MTAWVEGLKITAPTWRLGSLLQLAVCSASSIMRLSQFAMTCLFLIQNYFTVARGAIRSKLCGFDPDQLVEILPAEVTSGAAYFLRGEAGISFPTISGDVISSAGRTHCSATLHVVLDLLLAKRLRHWRSPDRKSTRLNSSHLGIS